MAKASPARLKANAKYAAKTYKRYAVNARLEFATIIDEYCEKHKISNSGLFLTAVKYCFENDIDLKSLSDKPELDDQ